MGNGNQCYKLLLILLFNGISKIESTFQKEITVNIEPGMRECFYQNGKVGETIDIEYQVIDGGHGDLDINFEMIEPSGRVIYTDLRKSDNIHRFDIQYDGDYRFCFDNSFSRFNHKLVFFELIFEDENDQANQNNAIDELEGLSISEYYDFKVQDILDGIGKIKMNLVKARQLQEFIKNYEARDRNVAEENFFKVNTWSMFQIFVMISVGSIQVIMLRSLFDSKSKIHKIWNQFS